MVQNQNNIAFLNIEKLQISNPHSFECHKKIFLKSMQYHLVSHPDSAKPQIFVFPSFP